MPRPGREEREDRVVRNREAAARVADEQAFGAGDRERRGLRDGAFLGRRGRQQSTRDERREALAEADLLVELVDVLHAELADGGRPATPA